MQGYGEKLMKTIKNLIIAIGLMAFSATSFAMTMVPGTGSTTVEDFTLTASTNDFASFSGEAPYVSPLYYGITLTEDSRVHAEGQSSFGDIAIGLTILDDMGMALAGVSGLGILDGILEAGSYFLQLDIADNSISYSGGIQVSAVPVPAAGILFASALFGAGFLGRRKKKATQSNMIGAFARAA